MWVSCGSKFGVKVFLLFFLPLLYCHSYLQHELSEDISIWHVDGNKTWMNNSVEIDMQNDNL